MTLSPRENALRIVRFDRPECVMAACPIHAISYFGCHHEGFDGGGHHMPVGSVWEDIWGTRWHLEHEGVMGFPRGNPLADLPRALAGYRWPDPDDERLVRRIYAQAARWTDREKTFLSGSHRDTLWEKCYMLVGMENAMCYFHTEPEALREVLHRIMDFQMGIARHYLRAGVEWVDLGDDLGTQCGLLLSPETIRSFLEPEYRRLFALYKERKVRINFHSCGHIAPALDLFLDLGVDLLNPVQASANDLDRVRAVTAGRMALQGGIRSDLLASGPIPAIREEVRRRIRQLGRDGGYFCAADQCLPTPDAHHRAMLEAIEEFGRYPLDPA